jgi:N-dimethylarginine dimethylaminohydrolase
MCPPDFFEIRYEINPWMSRTRGTDQTLAGEQWNRLQDTLRALGAELEFVPPQPGWPDLVFTANAGLVRDGQFLCSSFRHAERQGEAGWFKKWFSEHGYQIARLSGQCAFEGEGDALSCGDRLFCGHDYRTDWEAHAEIGARLGSNTVSLKLVNPHFYHLDTCFCPLSRSTVAWFPEAFDYKSQQRVRESGVDLIEVCRDEAWRFACNAVVLERDVVLPEGCPEFCAALAAEGYPCHPLPMGEFIKAGGACKCLVLRLEGVS